MSTLTLDSSTCPHCEGNLIDPFTFGNIGIANTRTVAVQVSGIYPWIAARCPFCGYTSPRPGFEQECLEFLDETSIQRSTRMQALPFYQGKDIITYQSDGTPVVYTAEERDADKGRDWDKEEAQMLYSDTGDHHPGILERLLNAAGNLVRRPYRKYVERPDDVPS